VPDVGDYATPQLTVDPYDATTAVTLTITAPSGATTAGTGLSSTDGGHTWTAAPVYYTASGWWVLTWTVRNTGAGLESQRIWVNSTPLPGGPAWTPDRARVADYVPGRTLVAAADGYGNPLNTFDATTHPTGTQVDRLIVDAVGWVLMKTGEIDPTLYDQATSVAAKFAASQVELGYPDRPDDINRAQQLYQQAVAARDDLARANIATTGEDVEDPAAHLLPIYSFPRADTWGDFGDDWFL
jgi:hypothetical protein